MSGNNPSSPQFAPLGCWARIPCVRACACACARPRVRMFTLVCARCKTCVRACVYVCRPRVCAHAHTFVVLIPRDLAWNEHQVDRRGKLSTCCPRARPLLSVDMLHPASPCYTHCNSLRGCILYLLLFAQESTFYTVSACWDAASAARSILYALHVTMYILHVVSGAPSRRATVGPRVWRGLRVRADPVLAVEGGLGTSLKIQGSLSLEVQRGLQLESGLVTTMRPPT